MKNKQHIRFYLINFQLLKLIVLDKVFLTYWRQYVKRISVFQEIITKYTAIRYTTQIDGLSIVPFPKWTFIGQRYCIYRAWSTFCRHARRFSQNESFVITRKAVSSPRLGLTRAFGIHQRRLWHQVEECREELCAIDNKRPTIDHDDEKGLFRY